MTWPEYFFGIIEAVKAKSKDPHTHVGCVIAGVDNEILTTGYNSFPRGILDDVPERLERPEKYLWIEHSERNAIYNAARRILKGSTIYMGALPCIDCARAIIQSGIVKIVISKESYAKWDSKKYDADVMAKSLTMLQEAKVEVEYV